MIDLSDEDFTEMLARKKAAVAAVAAGIIGRETEPRDFLSRRRWETVVLALIMVPERETPFAWRASTDGDDRNAVSLPKSQVSILTTDANGLFAVASMKAWVAIDRHMTQANMPQLSKTVAWADDERAAWRRIQTHTRSAREAINRRALRKDAPARKPLLTRNDVA